MSTEVTIQSNNTRPLYRKFVRDGVAGNYDVIYEMIRLIRNDVAYDKGVETVAKQILLSAGLDSFSSVDKQLEAIVNFVSKRVKYIQDVAGRTESLKSARQTLSDGYGDCDDQAVLCATLAGDLGFEDVRVAMAKYSGQSENFSHVYCVVHQDGKRYVLDTSLPESKLNKEVKAYQVKELNVFDTVNGLDGFSGAYNHIRFHAKKAAHTATKIIPNALHLLPTGFIAGNAIATGVNLMERSAGQTYSLPATASGINADLDNIITDLLHSRIAYDLAKTQALQLAAQIAAVEIKQDEKYTLSVVGQSIKDKLDFIKNFVQYADTNGIKVIYLDSQLMMYAGVGLAGVAGYALYKTYIKRG